jgi:hypothetical protein
MGRANGLLNNIYANRANFNRLKVNALKVKNIIHNNNNDNSQISYLFSLDILEASWDGSTLTFNKKLSNGENNISLIRFTDRPYRFDKHYVGEEAEIYIDNLFNESPEGFNSFKKDPPNGVLIVNSNSTNSLKERQEAFEIKLRTVSNGKISMILNLLENQNNIEPFINKPINLFIDNTHKYVGKKCKAYSFGNYKGKGTVIFLSFNNLYFCAGGQMTKAFTSFIAYNTEKTKGYKFGDGMFYNVVPMPD